MQSFNKRMKSSECQLLGAKKKGSHFPGGFESSYYQKKRKDTSYLCSFYATMSENTEAPYTQGSLKKWEKRKVITTQATQTYLRIAYTTCPLALDKTFNCNKLAKEAEKNLST